MPACSKCGASNTEGAATCASCSEPMDDPGPKDRAGDPGDLLGRVVNGKYEVLEVLGEGGMGVVYKVRHLILQNKNFFALKILRPRYSTLSNFHQRFLREVEIAMDLTHENIIQIRDFGVTEQNLLFYTMDYFPGRSLKKVIESEGALRPERAVGIARQILLALVEAHKIGVVHRDLKPDNVLIEAAPGRGDRVRILDFGIAKVMEAEGENDERNLTRGAVIGTPKYMSPEQAAGEKIDGRSDLYSLGVILYEILSGRVPFSGGTARSILLSHLTVNPRSFKDVRPDIKIPHRLEDIVHRLLEKEREARPATAAQVLSLLDGVSAGKRSLRAAGPGRIAARGLVAVFLGVVAAAAWIQIPGAREAFERLTVHALETGGSAPAPAPTEPSIGVREETPSRPARPRSGKLRCGVCGVVYAYGEKVGDMCHGEPLDPVE